MTFTKAWLGYDLPFAVVEDHPEVRALRARGLEKRIKTPEHHVTVGYFESVEMEALSRFLLLADSGRAASLATASFTFDGAGDIGEGERAYAYLSPSADGAGTALELRALLTASGLYDASKGCRDLHLSIGGPDPFSPDKPRRRTLATPLALSGKLVFVGQDGRNWRRFAWNPADRAFVEETPSEAPAPVTPAEPAPLPVRKIMLFPKIQPDTACAVFLLREHGERLFPGVSRAEVGFMTALPAGKTAEDFEKEGTLLIDLGQSRFDHHTDAHGRRDRCASGMIASYLGVDGRPELRKLLQYVKRDDLEGRGTISADPLDRAFGLSGIIMNMNRVHAAHPQAVLEFAVSVFAAHVFEEYRRQVEMPAEWKALKATGKGQELGVKARDGRALRLIAVESDNVGLPGFLRAFAKADVVALRMSSGHTNIISRQDARLDFRELAAAIRREEAALKGLPPEADAESLRKPNRLPGVEEWFHDTAATTLQNGGVNPDGVTPTRIAFPKVISLIQASL